LHPELSAEDIEHIDSAGGFSLGEPHMHNLNVEKYVPAATSSGRRSLCPDPDL